MADSYGEIASSNVHFTYKSNPDFSTLCQGDVLRITPELRDVLREIHPYFLNDQYKYFIVLTQSCDLIRRQGKDCKSAYISLAAVRDFNSFFDKEMTNKGYAKKVNGILLMNSEVKSRATQFIERIYNNTEPEYFFLYKDESLNFPTSMISYLKVSFSLKSKENYDICLNAKMIELTDEFKAKLGWLVGNIYSRVGTADWDSLLNQEEKDKLFRNEIESRCIVSGKAQLKQLETELLSSRITDVENAQTFISDIHIETNYDKVIIILEDILNKRKDIAGKERDTIMNYIKSNARLKQLIK